MTVKGRGGGHRSSSRHTRSRSRLRSSTNEVDRDVGEKISLGSDIVEGEIDVGSTRHTKS